MSIKRRDLLQIVKEAAEQLPAMAQLSKTDLTDIADRVVKKLDSIDMSLDLIYSAIVGTGEPIGVTRARQVAKGRAARAPVAGLTSPTRPAASPERET